MKFFTILAPLILSAGSLVLAHYDDYNDLYAREYDELASLNSRDLFERDARPDALAEAYHASYLAARNADPEPLQLERRTMLTYECVACGKKLVSSSTPNYCPNSKCRGHQSRDPHTIRYVGVAGKGGK
ncbi:hypothetical protein MMC17_004536 [Xylographa soralifera]|nr:hypothetical protein [Xylographa soralifera]